MSTNNQFLRNASKWLWGVIVLCVVVIVGNSYNNYRYATQGTSTTGTVVEFKMKRGSFSTGSANRYSQQATYPIIDYYDTRGEKQRFASSYSSRRFKIGDRMPIRYLNGAKANERIDTFSINWLFSIFAAIIMLFCTALNVVIKLIINHFKRREQYMATLMGKCTATIVEVKKFDTGWNVFLEGPIAERNNYAYRFSHFTFFESDHLIGKTAEVSYDPSDIERSYLVDIEHLYN